MGLYTIPYALFFCLARGMPGVSGVTVVTNARVYYTTRDCGRTRRPAFPAPLCPESLAECANWRLDQNRPLLELSPLRPKATEPVTERGTAPVSSSARQLEGLRARTEQGREWMMAQNDLVVVGIDVAKDQADE